MAKKKIMLFIAEGPTDETSLSTVLSRIFSSDKVKFQICHGDILTNDFPTPDKIVRTVYEQVKLFCGGIYKMSDICKIVHLTDMDGVYAPEIAIKMPETVDDTIKYPYYSETEILTPFPEHIARRNYCKRENINRLSVVSAIGGIPYSLYYLSSNLEHVLHNELNLTDRDKIRLSREFDLKYAEDPNGFIELMKNSSFSVNGTYHDTWAFIKADMHSLERHCNLGIMLPEQCDWKQNS